MVLLVCDSHLLFEGRRKLSGGYSGGVPPLPIPNREVKPAIADGTAPPGGRVGSCRFSEVPIEVTFSRDFFFCARGGACPKSTPSVSSTPARMAQKADCTLRSGLFGQPVGGVTVDAGGVLYWWCFLLAECVVGCVAVVTGRLWRAFVFWGRRLLFSCSRRHSGTCSGQCPSPFWQFDKFGAGNTFLLSVA